VFGDVDAYCCEKSIAVAQQKSLVFEECRVLLTACKSSLRRNKTSPSPEYNYFTLLS
jgi:hypothetical protein